MLLTHLNRVRALCILALRFLRAEAGVVEHEHGLEDGRVGGAPRHARVADDLLEGHVRIGQRSLDDLFHAPQQRCEARFACSRAFSNINSIECMAQVRGAKLSHTQPRCKAVRQYS